MLGAAISALYTALFLAAVVAPLPTFLATLLYLTFTLVEAALPLYGRQPDAAQFFLAGLATRDQSTAVLEGRENIATVREHVSTRFLLVFRILALVNGLLPDFGRERH